MFFESKQDKRLEKLSNHFVRKLSKNEHCTAGQKITRGDYALETPEDQPFVFKGGVSFNLEISYL